MTAASDATGDRLPDPTYVTTILGDGTICPISEVVGRRRLRRIAAESREGRRLLRSGAVTVLARDGRRFDGVPIAEVFDDLAGEISAASKDPDTDPRAVDDLCALAATLQRRAQLYS